MKRRDFITLLGGAAAALPLAARAQQGERMRGVGVLLGFAETDSEAKVRRRVFQAELEKLGWADGRNLRVDYRWAGGDASADRVRALAKELVELQPDVIVAQNTLHVTALLRETHTIPIVFVAVADPIGSGYVASLARPGGNITGFVTTESSLGGKWLELLKEIAPGVPRIAIMFNPRTAPAAGEYYLPPFEATAVSLAVKASAMRVHAASEIEGAIAALGGESRGGLVIMPDTFTHAAINRELIIKLAARHRIPVIYPFRFWVSEGGLISYGVDGNDLFRRVPAYIDRILRGAKPSDLPVQLPIKFELAINLKTAKALGLEIPPTLLARADEVIE
jgi:putative ABC transport system substrate-binding protein